ncbi:MAG: type III-A CRISPR-associated protein Csm2 [Candidatus Hatepunaea meridiana]|nr:type III-A CRISPR-associated protein Csm2 [Candidatus Hatepunaea meridiana]
MQSNKKNKCKVCGEWKANPPYDVCYNCSQQTRGASRGGRSQSFGGTIPDKCTMENFYLPESGCLRPEIFLKEAETLADIFMNAKPSMSQSSIRSMFGMLKSTERRIKHEKEFHIDCVREVYYRFIRHCEYQNKRNIIPDMFLDFANKHREIATRDKDQFRGFVEYLTSIMARMKTKPK